MPRIAILYPTDPGGRVPSGIDTFIRGILRLAPPDLTYTLIGATSDPQARPIGKSAQLQLPGRSVAFLPVVAMDAEGKRSRVPLTVRYLAAIRRMQAAGEFAGFDILDFHRMEPLVLFGDDRRPKNLFIHQDMVVIRDPNSDILWRHAPWLYEWFEARMFRRVDRVFCVRRSAVQRYQRSLPARADMFRFTPTWVDSTEFLPSADAAIRQTARTALRSKFGLPDEAVIAVFVGRLDRQKNPLLLLESAAPLLQAQPLLHFVLVGDGALRPDVEADIARRGLASRFTLTGSMHSRDIATLLRSSDLFVLSSAYEGMPIAVLEALSSGLPVVSTPVGEVPQVVRDGINGAISRDHTAAAFTEALAAVLAPPRPLRSEDCVASVATLQPEQVLAAIYENHRRQGALQ